MKLNKENYKGICTPIFWFSLLTLIILIIVYKSLNLPLHPFIGFYGLIFAVVYFSVIIFFYNVIFKFKEWAELKDLFKKNTKVIIEFTIKIIPFFILLYIYDSIHDITHLINSYEFDALLAKIDRAILFDNDIALIFERFIHPIVTKWLSVSYSTYFIFYIINPVIYFFLRKKQIFDIVLTTIIITCYLGLIGYILVPCVGPVLYQQELFSKELILPNGELYQNSNDVLASYIFSRGSFHCFPSLHFGITFAWLYLAWRYLRKEKYLKFAYYLHIPIILSLWLATLYLRWHYLIDWLGGLIVALIGIWLAPKIVRWWNKKSIFK